MGVKGLNTLLRKLCPNVFEEIHLSEYAFKKVAIDTSLFLCKFKAICGDRWLSAFINLICSLRRNEIHCVFIYDNGAPPEKAEEQAERRLQQAKLKERVINLEVALDKFYKSGEIEDILLELYDKTKDKPQQRLLGTNKNDYVDINIIKSKIEKMRSNMLQISKEDFELTKELFKILNIPFYDACLEAETTCSDLCKRGIVDAVLSEDTDVLAYSTPVFLTKIDTTTDTCIRLHHAEILNTLELTKEQFLDLCIMCSCDYNTNIPKIGPQTSYKYLRKYGLIENIKENIDIDLTNLKHTRTRELFTEYKQIDLQNIPYCGSPDFDLLNEFMKNHNIYYNIDTIKKCFTHNIIVMDE